MISASHLPSRGDGIISMFTGWQRERGPLKPLLAGTGQGASFSPLRVCATERGGGKSKSQEQKQRQKRQALTHPEKRSVAVAFAFCFCFLLLPLLLLLLFPFPHPLRPKRSRNLKAPCAVPAGRGFSGPWMAHGGGVRHGRLSTPQSPSPPGRGPDRKPQHPTAHTRATPQ